MRKLILGVSTASLLAFTGAELFIRTADAVRGRGFSSSERLRVLDGSIFVEPRIFCQFRPPANARYTVPGAEVRINSLGLRGPEVAREKPAGVIRVLCLGGSTTFDAYNRTDLHWPLLLERKLREDFPGRRIEVLNSGANGWTSAHSLSYLLFDGLAFSPDVVIVHHNVNDLSVNFHGEPRPDYANKYGLAEWDPCPERRLTALDRFFSWSQVYLYLRLKTYGMFPGRRVHVAPYDAALGLPAAPWFRRNLENTCAVAAAGGIRVVMTLAPEDILRRYDRTVVTHLGLAGSLRLPDAATYLRFHGEYNAIVREVARKFGAVVVDADAAMSGKEELFVDTCHTSIRGSEALAELFRRALGPLLQAGPVARAKGQPERQ